MALLQHFNALSIRKKMMVLHNLFFLVLALSLWMLLNSALDGLAVSDSEGEMARDAESLERITDKLRLQLATALLLIYGLAILMLELLILPHYVYRPIQRWLRSDAACQQGDRDRELIPEEKIFPDEIGQITRSRNLTVSMLRQGQEELRNALSRLETTAADLKRKNHLLETAKQNLADQDRLASLGMLSAGVAHELNSPLGVLHGSIEKLLEDSGSPRIASRLQRMLRVTQRLRSISESLLDFARARTQSMAEVRLSPLVDEAWELVRFDHKARPVGFENAVPKDARVFGNASRLLQVFVNLLRNSLDALDSKGRITVKAEAKTSEQKNWMVITVSDNGPGIEASILPKVFEPFVTSRLDARGTGLGLAVAEGIIHQHGGVIIASNRKEGGAAFEITLPVAGLEASSFPDRATSS